MHRPGRKRIWHGRVVWSEAGRDFATERVRWRTTDDLGPLRDQTVSFRFFLSRGSLFSFWVSPSPDGRSRGYVAAGGPGFDGAIDG